MGQRCELYLHAEGICWLGVLACEIPPAARFYPWVFKMVCLIAQRWISPSIRRDGWSKTVLALRGKIHGMTLTTTS